MTNTTSTLEAKYITARRTFTAVEDEISDIAHQHGLSAQEYVVLRLIADGAEKPGDLAEVLEASSPQVSNVLKILSGKGFIRSKDSENRRERPVELTKKSKGILEEQL